MTPAGEQTLALTKHEGAGNDFLVVLDPSGTLAPWVLAPALVRGLCDRHRGVGADGLIVVGSGRQGTEVAMDLRNADGSRAEMSGNGIRCLAQAAVDGGLVKGPTFTVATDAGVRTVDYRPADDRDDCAGPGPAWARVDMGGVALGHDVSPAPAPGTRAMTADVGNPHLVVLCDTVAAIDVAAIGPVIESGYPGGINVELIATAASTGAVALDLVVWERGAGRTLACGTGTVAAAEVARAWGLVDGTAPVVVHNPGGTLEVTLGAAPGDPVQLAGPVRKIAEVVVNVSAVEAAPAPAARQPVAAP